MSHTTNIKDFSRSLKFFRKNQKFHNCLFFSHFFLPKLNIDVWPYSSGIIWTCDIRLLATNCQSSPKLLVYLKYFQILKQLKISQKLLKKILKISKKSLKKSWKSQKKIVKKILKISKNKSLKKSWKSQKNR